MKTPTLVQFEKKLSTRQQEVQDDIIGLIRDMLLKAEMGEFIAVGMFAVYPDHSVMNTTSTNDCMPLLIGAAAVAQHDAAHRSMVTRTNEDVMRPEKAPGEKKPSTNAPDKDDTITIIDA